MQDENINPTKINLKFSLDLDLSITLPGKTTLEEIEKFILSKFVTNENFDLLESKNGKLRKKEKSTILEMSKYNDFNINLNELFKSMLNCDYTNLKEKSKEINSYKAPYIPSFFLKLDENDVIGSGSFGKILKCSFSKFCK